ncbi:MAG: UvrD-helicase domain-containing protein, partial [Chlamydiota bacterium]|nr:UvrD-helicase domain-containing protein [Chlamydiota bacterium]
MGSDILTDLNPQQLQAVTHTEGPLLIVAGPGSGKTRVITQRIAYLLDMGIDPESILAVSFTNKAAQEMRSRVNQCSKIPMGRWIGTFHSVCVRILRNHIHRLGVHNNFVIYDTQDQIHIVKESMKALNINEKDFRPQAVLSAISNAKNKLMTVQAFEEQIGDYFQKRVSEVYKLYQKKLHENHALDFDDIILKTVQLFSQETQILELLQNQFHYIMVDEYQD